MKIALNFSDVVLKIVSFFIVIMPLVNYYDLPGTDVSMTTVLLILETVLLSYYSIRHSVGSNKENLSVLFPYLALMAYIFLISVLTNFYDGNNENWVVLAALILNTVTIYYVLCISNRKAEFADYMFKLYLAICFFICVITIGEELIYLVSKRVYPVKFDFLPLSNEYERLDYRFGYNVRGSYVGFSPFFSEPSHLSQYLLPAIAILLGKIKKDPFKTCAFLILIEMAIVISTSTLGIVASLLMIGVYIFLGKTDSAKKFRRIAILCLPILILVYLFYIRGRLFYDSDASSMFSAGSDKTSYRIFRGFSYYFQFPLFNKLFGIGFGNMSSFVYTHNLTYDYEIASGGAVNEYLNGVSQALVYGGVISAVLLFMFYFKLFKNTTSEIKSLVFVLVILMMTAATFLRGTSVFYIILILGLRSVMSKNEKALNSKEAQQIQKTH